jgi:hypothetical protein
VEEEEGIEKSMAGTSDDERWGARAASGVWRVVHSERGRVTGMPSRCWVMVMKSLVAECVGGGQRNLLLLTSERRT